MKCKKKLIKSINGLIKQMKCKKNKHTQQLA